MSADDAKKMLLRAALAAAEPLGRREPLGVPSLDGALAGGLMRAGVHEVFAAAGHEGAATGFVAGLAVRLGGPLLWIRQDYAGVEYGELAATGLSDFGLDPDRLLLLLAPDAAGALKAAADALACTALGAVVIELMGTPRLLDLTAYRRLALAAARSGVTVLLLHLAALPADGGVETRWRVAAAPSGDADDWGRPVFAVELQRNRHGPGGFWVVEWRCGDGLFRPADCGAVVLAPGDQPPAPALAAASAA